MGSKGLRKPSASFGPLSTGKSDSGGVKASPRHGGYHGLGEPLRPSMDVARDSRGRDRHHFQGRKRGIKLVILGVTGELAGGTPARGSYCVRELGNPHGRWVSKAHGGSPSYSFLSAQHLGGTPYQLTKGTLRHGSFSAKSKPAPGQLGRATCPASSAQKFWSICTVRSAKQLRPAPHSFYRIPV